MFEVEADSGEEVVVGAEAETFIGTEVDEAVHDMFPSSSALLVVVADDGDDDGDDDDAVDSFIALLLKSGF